MVAPGLSFDVPGEFPRGWPALGPRARPVWPVFHDGSVELVACLPVIGLASFLGGRLNQKFAVTSFRRSVYAMLIALGIVLLWKAGG